MTRADFDRAVNEHYTAVVSTLSVLGARNPQDVLDTTVLELLVGGGYLDFVPGGDATFLTWIVEAAKLRMRRRTRSPRMVALNPRDAAPDTIEQIETRADVARILDRLPAELQWVARRVYFDGVPWRTVAKELGVPRKTLEGRFKQAAREIPPV